MKYLLIENNVIMKCLCKIKSVFKKIQQFDQDLNKNIGVTLNEAMIICSLSDSIKSSGELSSDTGVSVTRTSRVLSALETKQIVKRSVDIIDKRKMMFILTSIGLDKYQQISSLDINLDLSI